MVVYFTHHRKDDSGGLALADRQTVGIKDPPVKISQVIVTRLSAERVTLIQNTSGFHMQVNQVGSFYFQT